MQEADALITLGSALELSRRPGEGQETLREGLRLALDTEDHDTALRGYVNLSDILEGHGRAPGAATAAREGVELAGRVGLSRNFGAYLSGNLAESLVRLGEWDEASRLADEVAGIGLIGVFPASVEELMGYMAVKSGRLEEAEQHVRAARRQLGDNREPQFIQALLYIEADAARARGDLAAAAAMVADGLAESTAWSARYSWPLIWLGARINADARRAGPGPPRRAGGSPSYRARCSTDADRDAVAGRRGLPRPRRGRAPPRARTSPPPRAWAEAVQRLGGGRRPLAADLRAVPAGRGAVRGRRPDDGAPSRCARPRPPAGASAPSRCWTTSRRSPAGRAIDLDAGRRRRRRRRRAAGRLRAHRPRARGAGPGGGRPVQRADRHGAVHQPEDRERARVEHPGQARGERPDRGGRGRPPARPGGAAVNGTRAVLADADRAAG